MGFVFTWSQIYAFHRFVCVLLGSSPIFGLVNSGDRACHALQRRAGRAAIRDEALSAGYARIRANGECPRIWRAVAADRNGPHDPGSTNETVRRASLWQGCRAL